MAGALLARSVALRWVFLLRREPWRRTLQLRVGDDGRPEKQTFGVGQELFGRATMPTRFASLMQTL